MAISSLRGSIFPEWRNEREEGRTCDAMIASVTRRSRRRRVTSEPEDSTPHCVAHVPTPRTYRAKIFIVTRILQYNPSRADDRSRCTYEGIRKDTTQRKGKKE